MNQDKPLSAIPSVLARVIAFGSIIIAGLAGGLIGYTLVDLQCQGSCDIANSLGLVIGSVVGAIGMGVVSVLVLRATGEWKTYKDQQ